MLDVIQNLWLPLGVILVAMVVGTILERRHFTRIREREQTFRHMPLLTGKQYPLDRQVAEARMVMGCTVVSVDYFKRVLATLRFIFGGEVRAYCSLLDRGRRESLLRMREECPDADLIINVRVETSSISKGRGKAIGAAEVLAWGTAITFVREPVL
ncbi:MAG: heavy metal-binding domain-containing protein [Candidatus Delongbacteria bacterium]|nr:heavy metal-binding domain-containing protein [Candidatus Delongbacteria bacterium]